MNHHTSYLKEGGLFSWFTTLDHKKIGLMYFFTTMFFFLVGGIFALLIRYELWTPAATFPKDLYNKFFTYHGAIMVFMFIIPSIPASLGNFFLPLMLGAKDVAFPRLNLASYYIFVVGALFATATLFTGGVDTGWTFYTPYSITTLLIVMERVLGVGIFDASRGGDPVLFQHFFWFYSHPAVYIMILPGMGIISEVISVFSRKHIFGYKAIAYSSLAIAFISFLVWGHHMFVSSQSQWANLLFSVLTMLVAVPTAIKIFNWTATLYKGSIQLTTPMLYALSFIFLFSIGGLTGLFLAALSTDVHLHDTYFVVAHFHYVMVGGTVMGLLAGIHYWWPKMFGKMYSEFWAKISWFFIFVGFNVTFLPQFYMGRMGMPRRYATYEPVYETWHKVSTIGSWLLGVGFGLFFLYLAWSLFKGS